jgi:Domain of unknown function (DUF4432)
MPTSPDLAEIRRRTVDWRGIAEIRLVASEDGPGRGQRTILARNAAGLQFEVAVDRGFDLSALTWKGVNLGWHGPNRMPFPPASTTEDGDRGMMRVFDGFLVTCGLDHFGVAKEAPADHFIYPHRQRAHYAFHGRIALQGAELAGYGLDMEAAEPILWCEAVVRQTALFGEVLTLKRRIELPVFGTTIRLCDRVSNDGYRPARHGVLYHFNLGYPLLDQATRLFGDCGPSDVERFAAVPPAPADDFVELVDSLAVKAGSDGMATVGLANPALAGGMSVAIRQRLDQLTELMMWRCYQSGIFVVGIEPHTALSPDRVGYEGGANPDFLEPGQSRHYDLDIVVT